MLGISGEVPSLRTYYMLILYYMWCVWIPNYINVFVYPYWCCTLEVARPLLTCSLSSSVSSLESLGTVLPTSVPLPWPGSGLLRHRLSCSVCHLRLTSCGQKTLSSIWDQAQCSSHVRRHPSCSGWSLALYFSYMPYPGFLCSIFLLFPSCCTKIFAVNDLAQHNPLIVRETLGQELPVSWICRTWPSALLAGKVQ